MMKKYLLGFALLVIAMGIWLSADHAIIPTHAEKIQICEALNLEPGDTVSFGLHPFTCP